MKPERSYRRHGTADFPMAAYWSKATWGITHKSVYHPEIKIVMVIAGAITTEIDGVQRLYLPGDIYIIPSNTVYRHISYSEDTVLHFIVFLPMAVAPSPEHFFYREFVKPLEEQRLILPQLLQPDHPAYEHIRQQFLISQACKIHTENYRAIRYALLVQICTALLPYCQVINGGNALPYMPNDSIRLCIRYIHNHYPKKLTLQNLANYCHLNPHYLCELFKSCTGQTIFDYITHYRIEAAADLLQREELPISKVAELVGFRSESLFYEKFRKIMGTTPKAYKNALKNK